MTKRTRKDWLTTSLQTLNKTERKIARSVERNAFKVDKRNRVARKGKKKFI